MSLIVLGMDKVKEFVLLVAVATSLFHKKSCTYTCEAGLRLLRSL